MPGLMERYHVEEVQEENNRLADVTPDTINEDTEEVIDERNDEENVQEDADEIEKDNEALDVADKAMEAYADTIKFMQYSCENNGLSPQTAFAVHQNIGLIHQQLGMHIDTYNAETKSYSLESFSSVSGRKSATEYAVEENESKFKKFFKAIWDFIRKMINKVTSAVMSIFGTAERLIKKANKVREAAKNYKGKFKSELTEKQAAEYGDVFSLGNKQKDKLVDTMKETTDTLKKIKTPKYISTLTEFLKAIIDTGSTSKIAAWLSSNTLKVDFTFSNFFTAMRGGIDKLADDLSSKETTTLRTIWDKGDGKYLWSEELPGGYRLCYFISPMDSESPAIYLGWIRTNKPNKSVVFQNKNLPANPSDVGKICDYVVECAKNYKETLQAIRKFQDDMKTSVAKYEKECEKMEDSKVREIGHKLASLMRRCYMASSAPFISMVKYIMTLCRKSLDLCMITMSNAKVKA